MSVTVRAEGLAKRFYLIKSKKTALAVLKSLARGEPLTREHWVLRDVSFQVERGDKVALIGRNGSGKSTLLRIIAGIYSKTSGTLLVEGNPRPLLSSTAGLKSELSVVDNIYLFGAIHQVSRRALRALEQSILERTELAHLRHSPLKELSVGQVQRLALTVFMATPSDFLMFDEVIGHVDHGFRQAFYRYFEALADSSRTMIMTSHDAALLKRFCDKAIWLDGGTVRRFGPVDEVMEEYETSFREVTPRRPAPAHDARQRSADIAARSRAGQTLRAEVPGRQGARWSGESDPVGALRDGVRALVGTLPGRGVAGFDVLRRSVQRLSPLLSQPEHRSKHGASRDPIGCAQHLARRIASGLLPDRTSASKTGRLERSRRHLDRHLTPRLSGGRGGAVDVFRSDRSVSTGLCRGFRCDGARGRP